MFTVQTFNKISATGLDQFPRDTYDVRPDAEAPDAIVLRSYDLHDVALPPSVKAVARAGAGVNNIPVEQCSARGIVVFNTPAANANSVKELVIAGLLMASRRIVQGITWARSLAGQDGDVASLVEQGKKQFQGPEIMGKKLGVIGLGAIGVAVANDASALGMEVIGHDPFISVKAAWGLSRQVQRAESLESLIAQADYITIHAPLNDETRDLISDAQFALMKPGARLLNFARGGLVNEPALLKALDAGIVACYVTDFPDDALVQHDSVLAVPHLGASTPEAEDNCAVMAVLQIRDFLEHGNITNSVNFPEIHLPSHPGEYRIQIINRNEPNMIRQFAEVFAENGININNLINKGRGNLAYNIVALERPVDEDILHHLRTINGVITVRSLAPLPAAAVP
jgi:D-3-phosphoglycerate dehydrogenase